MAQKLYEETNIQAIADAIRGKNGLTNTYKTSEMAAAITAIEGGGVIEALDITSNGTYTAPEGIDGYSPITVNVPQDGSPPEEAFTITGDCSYRFAYGGWDWFIKNYGSRVTTNGISDCNSMFTHSQVTNIPFELNFSSSYINLSYMFSQCYKLQSIPKFNNCKVKNMSFIFESCRSIREFPDDLDTYFDWSYTSTINKSSMFYGCISLRKPPLNMFTHISDEDEPYKMNTNVAFGYCRCLDEIIDFPILYTKEQTSNIFNSIFKNCYRLKNITFAMPNGQPYIKSWKKQVLDLTSIGYVVVNWEKNDILNYNSGITADKEVTDDATYQALKDDPDWFTANVAYSRYNHDSAVATINSLPDTSAYLATAGGTNTIEFKGAAGSATDGGAINTLTEEEIAVATAKGWSVTLS